MMESRKAFRRIQSLLGEVRDDKQFPYAPGSSQEEQVEHDDCPGPENMEVPQGSQELAPASENVPFASRGQGCMLRN